LVIAAAVIFTIAVSSQQRSLGGPLVIAGKQGGTPGIGPAARSIPLTLSIPAIGLSVPLSELGLNPNHTVQVPVNFQEPGWYEFGPSPGQLGSSVILGHVDSYQGPAVFFRLRSLQPGDRVDVTLADGVMTHFVVREVAMYLKTNFPTLSVYGSHGYSALQLVTCGGVFDTQTRSYLSNVVVYTSLVSTS
jgi:LPXTG-site transpeptidase (sortase) family protein